MTQHEYDTWFSDWKRQLSEASTRRATERKVYPKLERTAYAYSGDGEIVSDQFNAEGDCW